MDKAIEVLVKAAERGQQAGAYTLKEAVAISIAIDSLTRKKEPPVKQEIQNEKEEPKV